MTKYIVVAGDFVKTGGMDRANYALASYLAKNGCETHLVAYRVDDELASIPNVIVHRVPKPANSYTLAEPLLGRIGRFWASKIARDGGRVVVNGGNCNWPDVNWVHHVHAAWCPMTKGRSLWKLRNHLKHRYTVAADGRAIGRARLTIANSDRTRRDLEEKLGLDPQRIRTIYYGIDTELFVPPSPAERIALRSELGWGDGPVVAFVGALGDRRKGFDVLFSAWSILCHQVEGWDATLAVVGAGAELGSWKRLAIERGLERRIEFLGFRRDVPKLLRACDAMVAPARYEAYGLAVHEALCCGLPAFVSAEAGVAERYPSELRCLLLDNPEDPEDLVKNLLFWRPLIQDWKQAITPVSCNLRKYSWDNMAADIVTSSYSAG